MGPLRGRAHATAQRGKCGVPILRLLCKTRRSGACFRSTTIHLPRPLLFSQPATMSFAPEAHYFTDANLAQLEENTRQIAEMTSDLRAWLRTTKPDPSQPIKPTPTAQAIQLAKLTLPAQLAKASAAMTPAAPRLPSQATLPAQHLAASRTSAHPEAAVGSSQFCIDQLREQEAAHDRHLEMISRFDQDLEPHLGPLDYRGKPGASAKVKHASPGSLDF